jgi:acyl-CoA thioesterase
MSIDDLNDQTHLHPPEAPAMAMYADDAASKGLGMEIVEVGYGRATVTMTIRADMVNGLDICHGGIIFALADSAMAFATNSYNRYAVATMAEIDWIRPGRKGAVLTAVAEERHKRGRSAITDVVVTDDSGLTIAVFRGRTRQIEGQHLPDPGR